jgi:hypothetical protein
MCTPGAAGGAIFFASSLARREKGSGIGDPARLVHGIDPPPGGIERAWRPGSHTAHDERLAAQASPAAHSTCVGRTMSPGAGRICPASGPARHAQREAACADRGFWRLMGRGERADAAVALYGDSDVIGPRGLLGRDRERSSAIPQVPAAGRLQVEEVVDVLTRDEQQVSWLDRMMVEEGDEFCVLPYDCRRSPPRHDLAEDTTCRFHVEQKPSS